MVITFIISKSIIFLLDLTHQICTINSINLPDDSNRSIFTELKKMKHSATANSYNARGGCNAQFIMHKTVTTLLGQDR